MRGLAKSPLPTIMRIDILTCLPELLVSPFAHSIVKRAQEKGLAEIHVHDLRQHAINKHGQIDDYVFGGGAGMVLRAEPIAAWMDALQAHRSYDAVIYLTPDGETLRQPLANRLSCWATSSCSAAITRALMSGFDRPISPTKSAWATTC